MLGECLKHLKKLGQDCLDWIEVAQQFRNIIFSLVINIVGSRSALESGASLE
jgi:hypothetical protein